MDTVKYKGYVKWFSTKGESFGYLHRFKHLDGAPGEIFGHYKQILPDNQENPKYRTLKKGDYVEFEIGPGYYCEGTQAMNIRLLRSAEQKGQDGT